MKTKTIKSIILFLIVVIVNITAVKAQKFIDKKGKITFEASEKLFEPVKAQNSSVTVILNTETNDIASLALIKSFRFKNSLMEEHFNENYIESETYPKATFKGKLIDFSISDLTDSNTKVIVEGKLLIHGKEKEIRTTLTIKKLGESIKINGEFKVTPGDFDIKIPSVVKNKIAKEVIVSMDFELIRK